MIKLLLILAVFVLAFSAHDVYQAARKIEGWISWMRCLTGWKSSQMSISHRPRKNGDGCVSTFSESMKKLWTLLTK